MSTKTNIAKQFLFDETYRMWRSDLEKIFRIGTRGKSGGCNFSSCILVLIGIESFSKFFSTKKDDKNAFIDFLKKHYPSHYHEETNQIYDLFRNGLAHYFYPKIKYDKNNATGIRFWLNKDMKVLSLSAIRKDLNYYRSRGMILSPEGKKPITIVPQVLFIDTVNVIEGLKKRIETDAELQQLVTNNYLKVRKGLNHIT